MATAVEPSSAPSTPGKLFGLTLASLIGAVYTLAAVVVVVTLLPTLWAEYVTPKLKDNLLDWLCWIPVLCASVVALTWFGNRLAGDSGTRGVHGGAFLMTCAAITIFFLSRAVAMWTEGSSLGGSTGLMISAAVAFVLCFVTIRFFSGRTAERWMVGLEDQGWFSGAQYKRALGVRVRRLTVLGVLLIGGTGLFSLYHHGFVPNQWVLAMPFGWQPITVMPAAQWGVGAILAAATLWLAFRAVNVPDFAEFLIATEAEMNKVSWSTRKRLAQDTVVVLVTTLIMTLFLLVVDLFWGWLLSRQTVGVLPARTTNPEKGKAHEAKW